MTVTHLQLDVRDLDRSASFYGEALALPVERAPTKLTIRQPSFLLVLAQGTPVVGGSFHFGFRLESAADVDAWFARAEGLRVLATPETRNGVYVGRIADPDGYIIELYAEVTG